MTSGSTTATIAEPTKRVKGCCSIARRLGVTYQHLSMVLHGHRVSASLSRRYQDYLARTGRDTDQQQQGR